MRVRSAVFVGCNATEDIKSVVEKHDVCILIDPLPDACGKLRKIFDQPSFRDKSVSVIQAACWKEHGKKRFNVYNKHGLSSSLGEVSDRAKNVFSWVDLSLRDTIEVDCIVLASVMPMWLSTLIIDAQGADLTILKTIEGWLANGRVEGVKIECDADGDKLYNGLEDNSRSGVISYMKQFAYVLESEQHNPMNPDLTFVLNQQATVLS